MGKSTALRRDIFFRLAKEEGYRARSAYKLIQLDEEFGFLDGARRVVDLCAAPGSWSQVLSSRLFETSDPSSDPDKTIVAVDLQPMAPIPGVTLLEGDITKSSTAHSVLSHFHGQKADIVVSDGAPDVTGLHDLDEFVQAQLMLAALSITLHVLKKGGTFVAKMFRARDVALLYNQLGCYFDSVTCAKPKSSRSSSLEGFVVCQSLREESSIPPSAESLDLPRLGLPYVQWPLDREASHPVSEERTIVPFVECGDLSGYDESVRRASSKPRPRPSYKEYLATKKPVHL